MKHLTILISSVFSLLAANLSLAQPSTDSWTQALDGDNRSPAYQQRDVYRHPQQTLQFFTITPQSTVLEIWPGGGWYTEILAPLLRGEGKLYAAHFPLNSSVEYFKKSRSSYDAKLTAQPSVYDRVDVSVLMPPDYTLIAPAGSVDVVVTFRNIHNWLKAGNQQAVFSAFYAALKPGGILGVVEHRAKPGTDIDTMIASGYVTEEKVKEMATIAGFQFVASSGINANPADSADHPRGVWTLPPSLRLGEQDRDKYLAIGESDRMTLKFIKPDE